MAGEPQPLQNNIAIVDAKGLPTQYFIRWAQQRQIDIKNGVTEDQVKQLIAETLAGINFENGLGISITGSLSNPPIRISLNAKFGDLSDVDMETTPPTDGQVPIYDAASGLWLPGDQTGGGGSGTGIGYMNVPFFRPNGTTNFGAGNFGGRAVLITEDCKITHISAFCTTAAPTSVVRPAIYSRHPTTGAIDTLQVQGPQVTGVAIGVVDLPLDAPFTAAAGLEIYVGFQVLTAALPLATVSTNETFFFGSTGALPATAPGASYGSGGSMCIFPKVEKSGGGGGSGDVTYPQLWSAISLGF